MWTRLYVCSLFANVCQVGGKWANVKGNSWWMTNKRLCYCRIFVKCGRQWEFTYGVHLPKHVRFCLAKHSLNVYTAKLNTIFLNIKIPKLEPKLDSKSVPQPILEHFGSRVNARISIRKMPPALDLVQTVFTATPNPHNIHILTDNLSLFRFQFGCSSSFYWSLKFKITHFRHLLLS